MSLESIATKRGFNLTGGFWKRFGVTFIEAPVEVVSSALSDYYQAKCEINLSANSLYESTKKRVNKSFIWQYKGHDWTIWMSANEEIAYVLALFLDTKTIVITHQKTSDYTKVKFFKSDRLIEHYHFGCNYTNPQEKIGHFLFGHDYWDVETIQYIDGFASEYRHLFCSSVRNLTKIEVQEILESGKRELGLLDRTFKFHNAYFSDCSEFLLPFNPSLEDVEYWMSKIARIDRFLLRKKVDYWNNIFSVPERVIKNN